MRIVVTGTSGQVASSLKALEGNGVEIVTLGRPMIDLNEPQSLKTPLLDLKPDVIVSAAAYTKVDQAEDEPEACFQINAKAPKILAQIADQLTIPIIHLSTDYVFNGQKPSPYLESDPTCPLSVYGHSKRDGELGVIETTPNHIILRTSWVYSQYGSNFLKTMLRLSQSRDELSIVSDQIGCPTSAHDIAKAIIAMAHSVTTIEKSVHYGIFHLCAPNATNWADFARYILTPSAESTHKPVRVTSIDTKDYPTKAQRPPNSRLDTSKLKSVYGLALPSWQESVTDVLQRLKTS